ncbi:MAG: DUF4430 domain-containing protein [Oscillospiraceae bacterium]|jgi:hypothetical protein|nr:DUF4430 domain-containing protein [Oscillospiraceae bacterium]
MKHIKRIACLLLSLLLLSFFGCGKETINRTLQIPEDGRVARAVFKGIQESGDIGIFNGNSNDITYQWLFMGSLLEEPRDENLLVTFSSAKTQEVKARLSAEHVQEFSFANGEEILGGPSLSVYFTYPWNADSAEVYQYDAQTDSLTLVATAALENVPNAVVTLIPQTFKGLFYLVGRTTQEQSTTEAAAGSEPGASATALGQSNKATDAYVNETKKPTVAEPATKDKYLTDEVPSGKPKPVEPEDVTVEKEKKHTATLSIRCDTILQNMDQFNQDKLPVLPKDGVIMPTRTVVFYEGESVFDVLQRETRASKIHMEFVFTPMYNSAYIEGIHNLYEFDCGSLSGWMYKVNGWFPNYGCSRYVLKNGDVIEWVYTCDLGRDVGGGYAVGELP